MRQILITSGLPYANGPLHLGHIIEAVQTDIWARFQRMRGHSCLYVCAEDTHGTPIMIRAQSEGVSPEHLIDRVAREHRRDYRDFLISHDYFHSTHSVENEQLTRSIYERLKQAGLISRRSVRQAFDTQANMFLPDRYVKGNCPRCEQANQYGDSCENCGATYTPADLKNPVSVVSGTPPVWRDSDHVFFRLSALEGMLREWLAGGNLQPAVTAKLAEWFQAGLQDWDISRDAPYFGLEIPGEPGKYFYVWFDAPIGYLSSFASLCRLRGLDFDTYLRPDSRAELYHFIGKDISYFHTLFWPAVLHGAGYRKPTTVCVHGFLTINGQKMSKSRGTFITARRYLDRLPPEYLRYYFAAKLSDGVDDVDLDLDELVKRTNAEIVGKLVNIAARCAGFLRPHGGRLSEALPEPALYAEFAAAGSQLASLYESRNYSAALREIMALADRANRYIDQTKPWVIAKDPSRKLEVLDIATQGINLFRALMTYLAPVLPQIAERAGQFLRCPLDNWDEPARPLLGSIIGSYETLATRIDAGAAAALIERAEAND